MPGSGVTWAQVQSIYVGPWLGPSMLSHRFVNPILAPSPPEDIAYVGPMIAPVGGGAWPRSVNPMLVLHGLRLGLSMLSHWSVHPRFVVRMPRVGLGWVYLCIYAGPRLGLSMLSHRSVNPILAPSPPYVGLCWPYGSLCEPIVTRVCPTSVRLTYAHGAPWLGLSIYLSIYVGPRLGLSMLSHRSVNPIWAPSPPYVGLCWPYGSLCEPIWPLSPPYVGLSRPYGSPCWRYVGLSSPHVDPMLVYLSMLALGWVYLCCHTGRSTLYGPHLPLMLAYVGPMVAYVSLFGPYLPLMLA